jgi:hypothetical protein
MPDFIYLNEGSDGFDPSMVHIKYENKTLEWIYDNWTDDTHPPTRIWSSVSDCDWQFNRTVYEGVHQVMCRWYNLGDHYCPEWHDFGWEGEWVLDYGDKARKGSAPMLVRAALWDLFDGWGGIDETCEHHFWSIGREACDTWYAYSDYQSWGMILEALSSNPRNYLSFIEKYKDVMEEWSNIMGYSYDECKARNLLRTVSRFNGITLRGAFGSPHDWDSCDKWELTPSQQPPCAATQAVVAVVSDGVEDETMSEEEGDALLEKIRRIRDEYLLKSERGQYYAFMYRTCSEEIIDIIHCSGAQRRRGDGEAAGQYQS